MTRAVAVGAPQTGDATYVFAKPDNIKLWVWRYAKTTRREIRLNRDNVAVSLGFLGRVVHGKSKAEWYKDLRMKIGEPLAYAAPDDGDGDVKERDVYEPYVFCAKAWQLSQIGAPSQNTAEQREGSEWHATDSEQVADA
jgi:hypothetical protein